MTSVTCRNRPAAGDETAHRRAPIDLLELPILGRFLRHRWSRLAMQLPVLAIAVVMVIHGWFGPDIASRNLALLLTWVHFRGLVVLALLLAGNLFCMACPLLVPRDAIRRFWQPKWNWPRKLRNKWLSIGLFVAVLFAYELFDLWSQPYWTAMLIVGYFGAATMVDVLFRRASFCKYVCPIGQFNFLGSTLSPLEVSVRDRDVCTTCTTKDCIRGRRAPAESVAAGHDVSQHSLPIIQRGCELALFQPRKVGNLDCTFCLDCVYACPHDNVGIRTRLGAQDLPSGAPRSGIGSLDRRLDFSVLAAVFTFGALLNALAMTSPIYALEQWISATTHCTVEWPILGSIFFVGLVLEPLVMLSVAAAFSRRSAGVNEPLVRTVNRFARSLIPLGFGIWLAHYGFHFFTGFLTVIPVTQDALVQLGWPILGEPLWHLVGMPKEAVYPIEIGMMVLGLVGSWIVAWRIAAEYDPKQIETTFLPWGIVHAVLFAAAVWIMTQPMDMRGTTLGG